MSGKQRDRAASRADRNANSSDSAGPTLSALLCVHNEAARLDACLAALRFCDEIVVVLDRCTDGSKAIAEARADVVLDGAWELEGPRRHAAMDAASGDWLLEIDADETVTPELAAELRTVIRSTDAAWHKIPFDNYVGGRLVRHGWGASFGVAEVGRLHRKGVKRWGGQRVHPAVSFDGPMGPRLTHAIQHDVDDGLGDMVDRLNRYTEMRAADLRASWAEAGARVTNGKRETLGRNIGRFFSRFYKCYVRRKGHREGAMGFAIAVLAGLYPLFSYLKAVAEEG